MNLPCHSFDECMRRLSDWLQLALGAAFTVGLTAFRFLRSASSVSAAG